MGRATTSALTATVRIGAEGSFEKTRTSHVLRPGVVLVKVMGTMLDEPTLGLDILYRKQFYQHLLEEYFDQNKTIIVTTHQVEEIEHILTDLMFIRDGKIVLSSTMDDIGTRFVEVMVPAENADRARALKPIDERQVFGKAVMLFDGVPREKVDALGESRTPGIADIFVALMRGTYA